MNMDDYIERLNRIADRYELPKKLNYDTIIEFTKECGSLKSIWGLCTKNLLNFETYISNTPVPINMYCRYPNSEEYVLKNCSFVIEPGEKVGLVGSNGSGKSTILKL
jgi:ABC-type multidrug transport system fused ATPase/permease subunit